ncbi:hypothetical protein [Paraburkholderia largidicola]|uniref:Lipoprotein n=1 Tax=Paraburkholderia largidicola TaxID=3014751 RepID=A0A7I8BJN9_9BURK|nr:hypothetical protein [Paraburkholderia sp. PGU16]BCF88653.1 hypothetical protein PPGU16_17200 [Paraburkholderia sp. PGU16]
MKRLRMLLAAGLAASLTLLAGCPATTPTLSFQQATALVCADANTVVQIMTDDGVFTGGALNTLNNDFKPALNKVCASGVTVTKPNLQALVDVGLPLLKTLVNASNLQQQMKNSANAAIDVATLAVNTAIALQPATSTTTPAAPAPASAPAAASAAVIAS